MRLNRRGLYPALFLLGFACSSLVAFLLFDAIPHVEDEHAILRQAKIFSSGAFSAELPAVPSAFSIPFMVEYEGRQFSKYHPGFSLLLVPGVLLDAPWLINACLSGLNLCLVFRLVGRNWNRQIAALTIFLLLCSPMFLAISGSLFSHTALLSCLLSFLHFFFRLRSDTSVRPAIFAGCALGFAACIRPFSAALLALPCVLTAVWHICATRDSARERYVRSYVILGSLTLLLCGVLPLYNYMTSGSAMTNAYTLIWPYDTLGFGPESGRGVGGHTFAKGLLNLKLDMRQYASLSLGWPSLAGVPLIVLPILAGLLLKPRRAQDLLLLLPLLILALGYTFYWARGGSLFGARYYFESIPFICALVAVGIYKLALLSKATSLTYLLVILTACWGAQSESLPMLAKLKDLYGIDASDSEVVDRAGISNALVFVSVRHWTDYGRLSWRNEADLQGDIVFAMDGGTVRNKAVRALHPHREVFSFDRRREPKLLSVEEPLDKREVIRK